MSPSNSAIKGIFILNTAGNVLLDLINDESSGVNPELLGSFCAAIALLGRENLGKIQEINIKGLDLNMALVTRHDLILIALIDPSISNVEVREEAEQALEMFHGQFHGILENWNGDQGLFKEFRAEMESQVKAFLRKAAQTKEGLFDKLLEIATKRAPNGKKEE
ncbi:MAG: hypothetical protein ACTSU5_02670 [Promethearchaeota archaeon]